MSTTAIRPRPKIEPEDRIQSIVDKALKPEYTLEPDAGYGVSSTWDAKDEDKLLDIIHDIRKNRDKKHLILSLVNDSVYIFY